MDNAAQWVRAQAYISKNKLTWSRDVGGTYNVFDKETSGWTWGMVSEPYGKHGFGKSLYEAVLDYLT